MNQKCEVIRFSYLEKSQKEQWLPVLFDLLYENMQEIAPEQIPCEQAKQLWLKEVSPALDKAPRQIILCFSDDELAGYLQYYTNGKLLMIEEVQIKKEYQRTTLFYSLCKYLNNMLPREIEIVEAYADPRNAPSRKLMTRLGMAEKDEGKFIHFSGSAAPIRTLLK